MELRVSNTRLRLHPLMLLLLPLAVMLGNGSEAAALAISLFLHEAAHLMCAGALHARINSLELMPFGGSAQLGNLYALPQHHVFLIAAAGPAANLALMFLSAALAQWRVISPLQALLSVRTNLTLMLFNLLPALPLDGGRMLYAVTANRMGRRRAAMIGIWLGRALSAALLAFSLYSVVRVGCLNLSPVFAAVFILSSARHEYDALAEADVIAVASAIESGEPIRPVCIFAVSNGVSVRQALRQLRPDASVLFAIYSDGRLIGFLDEGSMVRAAMVDPEAPVTDVKPCAWQSSIDQNNKKVSSL